MADTEMVAELADLFEVAEHRLRAESYERRRPLTYPRIAMTVEAHDGGWSSHRVEVQESAVRDLLREWDGGLQGDWVHAATELAERMVDQFAATLPYWYVPFTDFPELLMGASAFRGAFRDDPNRWLIDALIVPATVDYLEKLELTSTSARDSAKVVIEFLQRDYLTVDTVVAIGGISTTDDVVRHDDVEVRRLTPLERGALLSEAQGGSPGPGLAWRPINFNLPTHIVTLTTKHPRAVQPDFQADQLGVLT